MAGSHAAWRASTSAWPLAGGGGGVVTPTRRRRPPAPPAALNGRGSSAASCPGSICVPRPPPPAPATLLDRTGTIAPRPLASYLLPAYSQAAPCPRGPVGGEGGSPTGTPLPHPPPTGICVCAPPPPAPALGACLCERRSGASSRCSPAPTVARADRDVWPPPLLWDCKRTPVGWRRSRGGKSLMGGVVGRGGGGDGEVGYCVRGRAALGLELDES